MPVLTIDKQYQDGNVLTEAQLDAAFASIATLINSTGLGADNIQDNSIGPNEIQTSAITNTKLALNSVSTNKVQDAAITLSKLATTVSDFLMPTASILSYGGTTAPSGWLICDGTAVSRITYADLFALVGVRFGSGDGTTTFNIPDYRGRVLRMVDGSAGRDPDSAARTATATGGALGNNIGSVQDDAMLTHFHTTSFTTFTRGGGSSQCYSFNGDTAPVGGDSRNTDSKGSSTETRMKNAYVNMIIKI